MDLDVKHGLAQLKAYLKRQSPEALTAFSTLEERYYRNLQDERIIGPSEETRRVQSQIVYALNDLALQYTATTFNDFCTGRATSTETQTKLAQDNQDVKGSGENPSAAPLYGVGDRWAVLVGVNEYEDKIHYGKLQVCVKDAHALYEQLLANGFEKERVHLVTDQSLELPTRDNVLVTLSAVAKATQPDDLLLFYYSGHGDEDGGESYLVARSGKRLALEDTAIRISRIKQIMEQAAARAKVIVLDACHSGADISGKGSRKMTAEFIQRVFEQAAGLVILASCQQGQVSYEWRENERSVFTHFLLEALGGQADLDEKGFVTAQDANRHVTDGVRLWASQRKLSQTPTWEARVSGDIILVRYSPSN